MVLKFLLSVNLPCTAWRIFLLVFSEAVDSQLSGGVITT